MSISMAEQRRGDWLQNQLPNDDVRPDIRSELDELEGHMDVGTARCLLPKGRHCAFSRSCDPSECQLLEAQRLE
jgi:hypothetical protein